MLTLVNQNGCLERDPLFDLQPVKIPQNGRYVFRPHRSCRDGGRCLPQHVIDSASQAPIYSGCLESGAAAPGMYPVCTSLVNDDELMMT